MADRARASLSSRARALLREAVWGVGARGRPTGTRRLPPGAVFTPAEFYHGGPQPAPAYDRHYPAPGAVEVEMAADAKPAPERPMRPVTDAEYARLLTAYEALAWAVVPASVAVLVATDGVPDLFWYAPEAVGTRLRLLWRGGLESLEHAVEMQRIDRLFHADNEASAAERRTAERAEAWLQQVTRPEERAEWSDRSGCGCDDCAATSPPVVGRGLKLVAPSGRRWWIYYAPRWRVAYETPESHEEGAVLGLCVHARAHTQAAKAAVFALLLRTAEGEAEILERGNPTGYLVRPTW